MNNITSVNNLTIIRSYFEFHARFGLERLWITIIILSLLILCTVIGNVFVVAAILLEKHLQGVSNYLIASLAVADLMVATLPMPVAAIYEISEDWWLGEALCDFWVCSDVLCCTASILHLVGIALDRYWAVTNAEYIRRRTGRRIGIMIGIFWFLSVLISIPARFHTTRSYNYGGYSSNLDLNEPPSCRINQEHGYTVFSNIGAFYMPMIFIIGIYARIYQVARARIRRSAFKQSGTTNLCMSQWKQPKSKQQRQHSFRHHLNTYWCNCCHNYKNRYSAKLIPTRNNNNTSTNQENPSSSQVADTDCTMIGRKTITHIETPTVTMINNKNSMNNNSNNNDNNTFNSVQVSIPYVDDMETKSNYYQSNDNINKNHIYTKPIILHYCDKQSPNNNNEYTLNIYNEHCLYKHEMKFNYKEIKKFNSFNNLNSIINFNSYKHTLLSRYRNSAPSILVHLNNSSTFFTELTNSNSQSIESSTEHTNSMIWSSSSSPLPSTPSSSFSESSSFPIDDHYRQQNHQHHHHQHQHHHRQHHHRHQHNHHLHHSIHRHSNKHLHESNIKHKRNKLKKSIKNQNRYLPKLRCFYPCCSTKSTSSNQHFESYQINNKFDLLKNKNLIINQRKYLSYCCINKHKHYTLDHITSSNNNNTTNNNSNSNNNNEQGLYLESINETSNLTHSYYKQNTVNPTHTTTTIDNNNNSNNNNKSTNKYIKTHNHNSLKSSKNQLNLRKKLCHMFNIHNNNNNNNGNNVYNNKHIFTQSTSNLPSNMNTNILTMNKPNELQTQLNIPTTITTSLTINDEITMISNMIPIKQTQVNRERLEAKRERKAILTLAIITGCFLLCWLPFFIVALISPFTKNFKITKFGQSMILWLGYSNSLLNPIIYTIFSPDFRNAFRKILFGRYNLRSLSR
ncbi:unnamed protein product [Schistosoma spindalis]|nr:unnamed protein product [Schistosoma spindale]